MPLNYLKNFTTLSTNKNFFRSFSHTPTTIRAFPIITKTYHNFPKNPPKNSQKFHFFKHLKKTWYTITRARYFRAPVSEGVVWCVCLLRACSEDELAPRGPAESTVNGGWWWRVLHRLHWAFRSACLRSVGGD